MKQCPKCNGESFTVKEVVINIVTYDDDGDASDIELVNTNGCNHNDIECRSCGWTGSSRQLLPTWLVLFNRREKEREQKYY